MNGNRLVNGTQTIDFKLYTLASGGDRLDKHQRLHHGQAGSYSVNLGRWIQHFCDGYAVRLA
ncbi:hypothetical protein CCP3SC1_1730003 [Gammaproteobacteria bacterium]